MMVQSAKYTKMHRFQL